MGSTLNIEAEHVFNIPKVDLSSSPRVSREKYVGVETYPSLEQPLGRYRQIKVKDGYVKNEYVEVDTKRPTEPLSRFERLDVYPLINHDFVKYKPIDVKDGYVKKEYVKVDTRGSLTEPLNRFVKVDTKGPTEPLNRFEKVDTYPSLEYVFSKYEPQELRSVSSYITLRTHECQTVGCWSEEEKENVTITKFNNSSDPSNDKGAENNTKNLTDQEILEKQALYNRSFWEDF